MLAYTSGGSDGIDRWLTDAASQCYLDKAAYARLEAANHEAALARCNPNDLRAEQFLEGMNAARRRASEYEQQAVEAATKKVERTLKGTTQN